MQHCQDLFSNIKTLLQLFCTLPVTSATPERTFSTLKRIKTYLRSTISQERLNGLALTNTNKEENVTVEEISQVFIKNSDRRQENATTRLVKIKDYLNCTFFNIRT